MEIARTQPFPLTLTQTGFEADTDYVIAIMDDHAGDVASIQVTSDSNGDIEVELPNYFSRYDDEYRLEIYLDAGDGQLGDLVFVDTLTIMRPYVDYSLLADTEDDLEEAKTYEAVARAIINAITGGFLYQRQTVETVGLGNDYLSIPFRLNKLVSVYENDVLVFNAFPSDPDWQNIRDFAITPDRGAITVVLDGTGYNRLQGRPVNGRRGASDSFTKYNTNDSPNFQDMPYDSKNFSYQMGGSPMFPVNYDYVVTVETGWPIIPQDIKQATMLLINDLKCNNLPYINSYIREYESDQFTLKFERDIFLSDKTGNRIVDRILSAYVRPIYRLGVL